MLIETHLNAIIEKLNVKLKPKHHILTHYPRVIRSMGPVIHTWMMRMENKHQIFTSKIFFNDMYRFAKYFPIHWNIYFFIIAKAKLNKNYKNVTKSLSKFHQQSSLHNGFSFEDTIEASKIKSKIIDETFKRVIERNNLLLDRFYSIKSLHYNSFHYMEGFMLLTDNVFYEILTIISSNDSYYFICKPFDSIKYEHKFNAIEIKEKVNANDSIKLLNLYDLEYKRSHERIYLIDQSFIKCETLDVKCNVFEN